MVLFMPPCPLSRLLWYLAMVSQYLGGISVPVSWYRWIAGCSSTSDGHNRLNVSGTRLSAPLRYPHSIMSKSWNAINHRFTILLV